MDRFPVPMPRPLRLAAAPKFLPRALVFGGIMSLSIGLVSGCNLDSLGLDEGFGIETFDPSWVSASWTGGARGAPNDRTDRSPTRFVGNLCPTSAITLDSREILGPGSPFSLRIGNTCTIHVFVFTCITKGVPLPPNSLLNSCATDPLNTPHWPLGTTTLQSGRFGGWNSSPPTFAINLFFCSDESVLSYEPVRGCPKFSWNLK